MKNKKAISLIVLVIVIIVMTILAATVIITLSNTNIINEANNAVKKTEAQQIEEMKTLMLADGMLGKNPGQQQVGDTLLIWNDDEKRVMAIGDKNTERDGVTIPGGFGYVQGTKDTGLVIEDKEGNQFVWIPVEYTATGTTDSNGLDTGFTSVFKRGTYDSTTKKMTGAVPNEYLEPANVSETAAWKSMMQSVEKNHGFYIARFVAGVDDATEEEIKQGHLNSTEGRKLVSKKNVMYYYGMAYKNAGISDMYDSDAYVVSTLPYGVQWDAMLNFIASSGRDISQIKTESANAKLVTGLGEQILNIDDLVRTMGEFTMEYQKNGDMDFRIRRSVVSFADRLMAPEELGAGVMFRVALYIK